MSNAAAGGAYIQWGGGQHPEMEIQPQTDNESYTPFSLTDQWMSSLRMMHCTLYLLRMQCSSTRHQYLTGATHLVAQHCCSCDTFTRDIHNNVHPEPEPELNVLLEESACRCLHQLPASSASELVMLLD